MSGFRHARSSILHPSSNRKSHRSALLEPCSPISRELLRMLRIRPVYCTTKNIGVPGRLYRWLANYLTSRTVFVFSNDGDTPSHVVIFGFGQGAVLSPHINCFPSLLLIFLRSFQEPYTILTTCSCGFHL